MIIDHGIMGQPDGHDSMCLADEAVDFFGINIQLTTILTIKMAIFLYTTSLDKPSWLQHLCEDERRVV